MRQLKISKSITNRESASLDKYLTEIGKHELISAEEEVILAGRIRLGDQEAIDKLTNANLRFVVSVAKQYQNRGMTLPDLINEGNMGLIKAVKRFDESRGFKFISYAVWWIRQSILQAVNEQSRMIRLPLNKVGSLNQIRKTQGILEQRLEREPSIEEMATELQISESEVQINLSISGRHVSTDALIGDSESMSLMDLLVNHDAVQPDEELMSTSLQTEIKRALSTLTERERDIIGLYYGIGYKHGFTLEEIGERYELTRERVRQIKEKAIRRLKHVSRSKILKTYLG
jgi:RNA polymerase primary sigma factor